ncbi:hypothetical protein RGR602_CH03331 [Rhizobium gallicum bv. gallicum R602sp]|uniref:Uncharacterized protein n=1 Tax=Rhizobium gallicum bv. gallicum R602sp TaxID=1041138 RepID=A0A0B4X7D0_9HYPH|nr:hypothetical protein RGR602_CH03331 [Rhizobium gallicum bv. gallicum R602sp]
MRIVFDASGRIWYEDRSMLGLVGVTAVKHVQQHQYVADRLTILGALSTDFSTFGAGVLVVRRTQQHEMRRGPADFRASHHEGEVVFLDVGASHFERQTG